MVIRRQFQANRRRPGSRESPVRLVAQIHGACDHIRRSRVRADGNTPGEVDELLNTGQLRRVLAQVEVSYSNSMIEAWWRSLKHAWLYLHSLDSVAAVERLVAFYVEQHNTIMPHRAFDGRTPDEVYFGTAANLERELAQRRLQARLDRVAMNRALTCNTCVARDAPTEALPREAA